jgi:uncharacterized membrane protein YkoI
MTPTPPPSLLATLLVPRSQLGVGLFEVERLPVMIIRKALFPALLSALLLTSAPVLSAQTTACSVASENEVGAEKPSNTTLKAFEQVKVSIDDAISATEGTKGGTVIGASFDVRNGNPIYRVKTYQNNSVWEGMVDAQTGNMIGTGKTTPENQLDQEDKAELAGLSQAYTSLAEAVVMAEDRDAGRAISVGLEETNGKIVFEVKVVDKYASVKKMVVDPKNGLPARTIASGGRLVS